MALQGELIIGGRKYGIVECEYEFNQTMDSTGKPCTRPRGGVITFVMPSTNDSDPFFYMWMFNKTEVHDGVFRFVIYSENNKRSFKTVAFFKAFCVSLKDYFNNNDSKLMYTTITISAEMLTIGSTTYNNEWT